MTRAEAIEKLELLRQQVDEDTYRALIMGIKALEQECGYRCDKCVDAECPSRICEHQEPCEDAISRENERR